MAPANKAPKGSGMVWRDEVPTSGTITLPSHALHSLGRNHSLATALADLVDNSLDAEAL